MRAKQGIAGLCCLIAGLAISANAAEITWGSAQDIAGDTDVSINGFSVFGASFDTASDVTVNGVTFRGGGTATTLQNSEVYGDDLTYSVNRNHDTAYTSTANPFASLSSNYKALLDGGLYSTLAGNVSVPMTLGNLITNLDYEVQIWVNDPRLTVDRTISVDGETTLDYNINNIAGSLGQYVIGTFTADAVTQSFTLSVTNGGWQINALQLRVTGGDIPTVAEIEATPTQGTPPLAVVFDGSGSISSGIITSYVWDFGDGNTGSGVLITNTYTSANTYTAWLTVTDDIGNTASNSVLITVTNAPLVAAVSATPVTGIAPLEVVFDGSGSSASTGGSITNYAWTFGDGNADSGAVVSNTYAAGNYTATLVVADSNGLYDTNTVVIQAYPEPLVEFTTQTAGTTATETFPSNFVAVSTNDLANSDQATFSSIVDNNGTIDAGQLPRLIDGIAGTSAQDGTEVMLQGEDSLTIHFDTSVNELGYDITNINTYAAWSTGAGGRASQGYDVMVTFMDDTSLVVSYGTYEANPTPNSWTAVYMTGLTENGGVIASGVKAITFSNFDEYPTGSTLVEVYREIDVLGTPTQSGEIGEVGIATVSGGQVVLTWESGIEANVLTNASLVYPNWGVAVPNAVPPVTNAIGSEAQLFYKLEK
ncbi:PKD domain-containing protein [Pontiellaceae bacterium B12219]|nr:PKD domain-containing protein [Pontiellaceae bacterium B12219]